MSLYTNVTARYSTPRLKSLTNPDDPDATTIDTSRLQLACDDVEAEFLNAGIEYDDASDQHVSVAVDGVISLLTERMGSTDGATRLEAFRKRLDRFRLVTSNDYIEPGTATFYQSTVPGSDGRVVRPPFDDTVFSGVQLAKPLSGPSVTDGDE